MRKMLPVLVVVACALAWAPAASASSSQFTIFEAPREMLHDDGGIREGTLDEVDALGADAIRLTIYWRDVAPDAGAAKVPAFDERSPASYAFARYDRAIDAARARGLRVLLTVSGPVPRWATAARADTVSRPSPTRFGRFMTAVGTHFKDRVDYWSIWNEPNHPRFLAPQYDKGRPASPRIYRSLFRSAEKALTATGVRRPILMGETAPRGNSNVVHPVTFLRGTLCLSSAWRKSRSCGKLRADGYAHHPYTTAAGPAWVPSDTDDVTIGALSRLTRALDRAGHAGAILKGMPVYLTEFGIQSYPDKINGVHPTRQAEYRSMGERIAYRNSRVKAFSQYLMRDDGEREGATGAARFGGFETGLRTPGGEAKPALGGFRLPLVADRGSSRVTLWGLVRPATGATPVTIEYQSGSTWRRLKTDRTDSRGYWTTTTAYRKDRRYRVVWNDHTGAETRALR